MKEKIKTSTVHLLDDDKKCRKLDPAGIIHLTSAFPEQCRAAAGMGARFVAENSLPGRPIDGVIFVGMGGSAIGGDLLQALMTKYGKVPFSVSRTYELPAWATRNTLVLAASCSGDTEETLAAYDAARAKGAMVVCVTSGGELAKRAKRHKAPVCIVPGGQPPRTATGYMMFPFLAYLVRIGVLDHDIEPDLEPTFTRMDVLANEYGPGQPFAKNLAKQLAANLHGSIPVAYGTQGYLSALALRWKSQFNENAKNHAFSYPIPEQSHSEILGWKSCKDLAPKWSVIYLRDPAEKLARSRIGKRIEITKGIIADTARQFEFWSEGESIMERMFSLFVLGDFASVYLGYLNGVDPHDISAIDTLKRELAG